MLPAIWKENFDVRAYDVGPDGRATAHALCGVLLEAAGNHAAAGGFGFHDMAAKGLVWVLTRFKVVVNRYPGWKEAARIETWAKGRDHLFYIRDFLILDERGAALAAASSSWAVLDLEKRRPMGGDVLERDFPQDLGKHALTEKLEKIPPLERPEVFEDYRVRSSDLDLNRHANSIRYVQWILDSLPVEMDLGRRPKTLEINYMAEARLGETLRVGIQRVEKAPGAFLAAIWRPPDNTEIARARFQAG